MSGLTTRTVRLLVGLALALLMLAGTASTTSAATLIGDWKLKGNLKNATGTNVKLEAIGVPEFQPSNVNGTPRQALVFDEGEGVKLTRVPRSGRASYSILIYFEFDAISSYRRILSWGASLDDPALYQTGGHLALYPYAEEARASLDANDWARVLITRDGRSNIVRIYVNGRLRVLYLDYARELLFRDGTANLFVDNFSENGSGTIAQLRLWRGVVNP